MKENFFADKNRIAIMTWYTYYNYGTALQASALYNVIKNMGYNPDIVNYKPKNTVKILTKREIINKIYNKFISRKQSSYNSSLREAKFISFLDNRISLTEEALTYPELFGLNNNYDAFVCGSDQIWSPLCFDRNYFLPFVDNSDKLIAYAPSIGTFEVKDADIAEKMGQLISRFKHLSVREKAGAEIIKNLCDKTAKVVLDPVFLLNKTEWDNFADVDSVQLLDKKYILCYFLGNAKKYSRYVKAMQRKYKMPVYVIPTTLRQAQDNKLPFEVGPAEFVSLIKHAAHVCTDSFHGVAFSLIYEIPFTVFKRFSDNDFNNQNSRIFNILELLGQKERLVDYSDVSKIDNICGCEFAATSTRLHVLAEDSKKYLHDALQAAVSTVSTESVYKITDICCGCGACEAVCNNNAIKIEQDGGGFQHYSIDTEKCVECGLCKSVCPQNAPFAGHLKNAKSLYAVKSQSLKTLKKSSSGGAAFEIAKLLNQEYGAFVYGCMYNEESDCAEHIEIEPKKPEKLKLLQGSKYIQSVSVQAIKKITERSVSNKCVFFGTPCQVAAVSKLLKWRKRLDNVVLVDLICHGVPSIYLWNAYLKERAEKNNIGSHPHVEFRNKEFAWWRRLLLLLSQDGQHKYVCWERKDDFYAFFRRPLCYMETCFDCPYREKSAADIRLGDYWGERYRNDKDGVSMVITNSLKGEEILAELAAKNKLLIRRNDLQEYWSVQYPYNPGRPSFREKLINELKEQNIPLSELRARYCSSFDIVEHLADLYSNVKNLTKLR